MNGGGNIMGRLPELLRTNLYRGLRFVFRMVPMRESTRDRLRERFLSRFPAATPQGPRGRPVERSPRRAVVRTDAPALGFVERRSVAGAAAGATAGCSAAGGTTGDWAYADGTPSAATTPAPTSSRSFIARIVPRKAARNPD